MEMNHLDAASLQEILGREGSSLLQYARDSYPWASRDKRIVLERLNELIEDEQKSAAAIANLLTRSHYALPAMGAYPSDFTTINFISLDYLLPELVQAQQRALASIEAAVIQISHERARATVEGLLDTKRRDLKVLEDLAASRPETAVA
jgi:hypothetical protein